MLKGVVAAVLLAVAVQGCDETNPLTDDYCYIEYDSGTGVGTSYTCTCPWTTCERKANTNLPEHTCNVTSFAIVFWTIGSLLGCFAICICIYCCMRSRRREESSYIYAPQPVYGTPVYTQPPPQQPHVYPQPPPPECHGQTAV